MYYFLTFGVVKKTTLKGYNFINSFKGLGLFLLQLGYVYFIVESGLPQGAKFPIVFAGLGGIVFLAFKLKCWKEMAVFGMFYTIIGGFLMPVPRLPIVYETIRNQYFHVTMWMAMIIVLFASALHAIKYLNKGHLRDDVLSSEFANLGIIFGVLGIITGMIWANYTWGDPWHGDPKQVSAAIGLLVYFALMVLRASFTDDVKRARIGAIYNLFAFPLLIVLLFTVPRMYDSLHPGAGGNPAFGKYDLDNSMRMVFYAAIIAWTLLGVWIATLRIRVRLLELKAYDVL